MGLLYTLFKMGYDKYGYDKYGFDKNGYDSDGYQINGFNRDGFNRFGYDLLGYNREGYDVLGFNKYGFNQFGLDKYGYNSDGFDSFGYDQRGFDKNGLDKDGYDNEGYGLDGFDKLGYNREGFDRRGYSKDNFDKKCISHEEENIIHQNSSIFEKEIDNLFSQFDDLQTNDSNTEARKHGQEKYNLVSLLKMLESPELIRLISNGEVTTTSLFVSRTYELERSSLFCEKIFGPINTCECGCGSIKTYKYHGDYCPFCKEPVVCDVKLTMNDSFGYIELTEPVAHIEFLKGYPSAMGTFLEMSSYTLNRILDYKDYIVIDPGESDLKYKQVISRDKYLEYRRVYNNTLDIRTGAKPLKEILSKIDLCELSNEYKDQINKSEDSDNGLLSKKLSLIEEFIRLGYKPEWMVLDVIIVIPAYYRPLFMFENNCFVMEETNDYYEDVIRTNKSLKRAKEMFPHYMINGSFEDYRKKVDKLLNLLIRKYATKG